MEARLVNSLEAISMIRGGGLRSDANTGGTVDFTKYAAYFAGQFECKEERRRMVLWT